MGRGDLTSRKAKRKPVPRAIHKVNRMKFCEAYMDLGESWKRVIFSDEKKFNLDGPDGFSYYWHGLGANSPLLSQRTFGGGSLMAWAGFNFSGKTEIVFIDGSINSSKYQSVLGRYLLPFMDSQMHRDCIFQQDNARPHTAKATKEWIEREGIVCLDWPAYSPDLNPIENLWGILVRGVFSNGRQFDEIEELKKAILEAWDSIEPSILQNLILSMKQRMFSVMVNQGAHTDY